MPSGTAIGLTGEDLTVDDVWAVAVEGAAVALPSGPRADGRRARAVVDRAAHGAERAHLRRQHGLRPLRLEVDPGGADRGAAAAAAAQPRLRRRRAVSGRGRPRGDGAARQRARQGPLGRAARARRAAARLPRPRRAPVVPSRGSVGASGDLAPLAHLALPLVGEGEAWFGGERLPGAEALARAGLEPVRLQAKEGLSLVNGTQFMAAFGGARARARAAAGEDAPTSPCALSLEALQGSRTSFLPAGARACARCAGQQDSAANVLALLEGSAIIEAHRWCDKVQDAYSLRCAPQVHGAARDLLDYVDYTVSVELNAATDNPLVLVEDGLLVSNGNFHGQPARVRARRARDRGRRAGEHLGAPRRAARQPEPLGRAAAVPDGRGRPQLGLHDPAVRGRLAGQREQGAGPPRQRRLDPDQRRPGGPRLDGERRRAEGLAGARERRVDARDRVARRRAGGRVPGAARAGARRRGGATASSARSRRG